MTSTLGLPRVLRAAMICRLTLDGPTSALSTRTKAAHPRSGEGLGRVGAHAAQAEDRDGARLQPGESIGTDQQGRPRKRFRHGPTSPPAHRPCACPPCPPRRGGLRGRGNRGSCAPYPRSMPRASPRRGRRPWRRQRLWDEGEPLAAACGRTARTAPRRARGRRSCPPCATTSPSRRGS